MVPGIRPITPGIPGTDIRATTEPRIRRVMRQELVAAHVSRTPLTVAVPPVPVVAVPVVLPGTVALEIVRQQPILLPADR